MKRIVTLVSREQAEVGHRFRVFGIPDECRECRLYSVCLGRLTPGRSYIVVEVRPSMGQKCKITGGEMVPVVVEETPIVGLLPLNKALEGVVVTYEDECAGCDGCPSNMVSKGEKIKVVKVLGRAKCRGREFAIVEFYALGAPSLSGASSAGISQAPSRVPLSKPPSKSPSPQKSSPRGPTSRLP
ncbi:UPF0179 family protein [Pyrobaculum calidifontis]|uniref:UPF0179 protein Pcal_2106 n=1 Tax=Pyrobaculum calidifontis (strain DSM 21063 / JCM 11548 / VA1) TaxID=410359 RepID=Y2106_PYRCJ|nr:UPF0179 family protein [Pyrobaculum calidifontis]A3MY04.1 RecName: Full=UPF0179 protein Pcal_2106 [Pyrobaculum calidifontis JCM 11548]ABO09521.1 conserved hypothetical protein [Pyrobaculum calidifontis JCM 11548]